MERERTKAKDDKYLNEIKWQQKREEEDRLKTPKVPQANTPPWPRAAQAKFWAQEHLLHFL